MSDFLSDDTMDRYDAAIALKEAGDVEHAIEQLEQLCGDRPDFSLPHAALSMIYARLGAHVPALEHATRVCELEPEDPFSFTALSALAIKSGDHAAAEDALGKARMIQMKFYHDQRAAAENTDSAAAQPET